MKKFLIVLLVIALLITGGIVAFKTLPAPKTLGTSALFSESAIADGAKTAEKCVRNFSGVLRILRVTYDEEKAESFLASDFESGAKTKENTMVFFVDFATGSRTTALNPWDVYTDYAVILTRANKNAPFEMTDGGY